MKVTIHLYLELRLRMSGNSSALSISLHDMHRNNFNFYLDFILSVFAILNLYLSDI